MALAEALGRPVAARGVSWLPVRLAASVWPLARWSLQVRHPWEMPHRRESESFDRLLSDFRETPPVETLRDAVSA